MGEANTQISNVMHVRLDQDTDMFESGSEVNVVYVHCAAHYLHCMRHSQIVNVCRQK